MVKSNVCGLVWLGLTLIYFNRFFNVSRSLSTIKTGFIFITFLLDLFRLYLVNDTEDMTSKLVYIFHLVDLDFLYRVPTLSPSSHLDPSPLISKKKKKTIN